MIPVKVRRGTDAQLATITLQAGELGFTTDKEELWVGVATGHALIGRVKVGSDTSSRDSAGVQGRAFFAYNAKKLSIDTGAEWMDVSGGGGGLDWSNHVTSNTTASNGKGYQVGTNTAAVTITLPASPNDGDLIGILDEDGNASGNNITIAPNGKKINGSINNFIIDTDRTGITIVYSSTSGNWAITNEIFAGSGGGGSGTQGTQGVQGPQGYQGVAGIDGAQGPQGAAGASGSDGSQGPQGVQGAEGAGTQGPQGNAGDNGAQGPQGLAGSDGVQGPQGNVGSDGADGAQGNQGWQGPQAAGGGGGLDWTNHITANTTATSGNGYQVGTNTAAVTITLPASPSDGDLIGILDEDGNASGNNITVTPNGKKINGSTDNFIIDTDKTCITFVYSSTTGNWAITDEIFAGSGGGGGGSGTQGAQGSQGPQGLQGTSGTQGPQGLQGTDGAQGPQGFTGNNGAQGSQGPQGLQGTDGSSGSQGAQGTQGYQGPQGWQGVSGPQGYQGTQGPQGAQGWQGVQGWQGGGSVAWNYYTTSGLTAQAGRGYKVNSSGGSVTITLPASPTDGDMVGVVDVYGGATSNSIVIARNGKKINNVAADYIMNTDNKAALFAYDNTLGSWAIVGYYPGADEGGEAVYYYGGRDSSAVLNYCDAFNGSNWRNETDVIAPNRHVAAYFNLSSKAYWAGGSSNTSYTGLVTDCDYYDGDAWSSATDISSARRVHAAFVLSSNAYICGGVNGSGTYLRTCDYFNGSSWTNTTDIPTPARGELAGVSMSSKGVIAGGYNGSSAISDCDSYNGSSWTSENNIPTPARADSAASNPSGDAYIYGGWQTGSTYLQDCDKFNGTTWSNSTSMPSPTRGYPAAADMNSVVYVGGGHSSSWWADLDAFDESSWTSKTDMDAARGEEGAATL